jgi:predicted DNA-binding transcriptional regulator YafY
MAADTHTKLQRWTDLIAALLVRRLGGSFNDIAADVPAYQNALHELPRDSVKRTFERDKDELRALGIHIETLPSDDSEHTRYRLRPTDFYLPFLALDQGSPRARGAPAAVTLTGDDMDLVGQAIARLQDLGDPMLADDARAAANKLAFDLPLYEHAVGDVRLLDGDDGADPKLFSLLGAALRARKVVSFTYHKPSDDSRTRREVEPYGLFFVHAHWYLAGRDRTRDAIRNFRLSRMTEAAVNRKKPGSPDYDIPASFQLREHARSRDSWELGEGDALLAEVEFEGAAGAVAAAARMGEPAGGNRRRFEVRRLDSFARWLMSFAGDARPVSPPELISLYERSLRDTLALYARQP